ncbi:NACHT, LRR and PYD domains-containing protein 12-like isoform X2 [Colossoma macropomum]|uniref:NACHT, LRR and PYD domains-containing protein 12-like isoform X2 n=1 Tax=Colossoma macropomum TaxID=42526 RepID=UPI001864C114|nr:NACHT, LRR and PYD domains-containing protein 12-like isoform X2 [Colossoma macropomum]
MSSNHLKEEAGDMDSKSSTTPAQMVSTVTAQTGGSVHAPMLHGNVFQGQVIINLDSSSAASNTPEPAQTSPTSNTNTDQTEDSPSDQVLTGDKNHCIIKEKFQTSFKKQFGKLYVGTSTDGDLVLLKSIFTELYVIKGCTGGVYNEHEVRQMEAFNPRTDETPVQFSEIFKACTGQNLNGTKVLTVGIAGVGKTVSVRKFILDWADGKSNQDIDLIWFLPFRELNLIKDEHYTLRELILYFHGELHDLKENEMFSGNCRVAIILDGLDESRIPLDFNQKKLSNATEKATIDKLLTNLIKGELLPSALIWITSRPAAANQIPRRYFDHITEIRGFTDQQKDEYFRKMIRDQDKASRIISHIKSLRSLHILCHIPVFCWIAASVLLQMFTDHKDMKTAPTTLTEMYTRFLLYQTTQMSEKYNRKKEEENEVQKNSVEVLDVLKLANLAFLQLEKGQLIFYESDLKDCDIDVDQALVYSGVCTQIFRKDETVFSFVHLSFQEFLAALYVFLTFNPECNPLIQNISEKIKWRLGKHRLFDLHKTAVNKVLQSEKGHLDLFLRFLLGLSLQSNQRLLKSLQPQMKIREESLKDTTDYIKKKIRETESSERCINLFHCLNELKDDSFVTEIQNFLKSGYFSTHSLSSSQWSALVFVLLTSEETQEKFDLKKYRQSSEGLKRLLPVIKNTRQALLDQCNLTTESYKDLISILSSDSSPLRTLDLSNNDLHDSGMMLLSAGLNSPYCKLEILRLSCCGLTKDGCEVLESVLKSDLPLRELDLSYNNLQDTGVEVLSAGLKTSQCKLEVLRMCCCRFREDSCKVLASVLRSDSSALKELDLSHNELEDRGVKFLCAGLATQHCKLQILRLSLCILTKKSCFFLASALKSNPSHLRELDLSYNHPGHLGLELLSAKLKDPQCKLETLNVDHAGEFRIRPGPRKCLCLRAHFGPKHSTHTSLFVRRQQNSE